MTSAPHNFPSGAATLALLMPSERCSARDVEKSVQSESAFSATKCWLDNKGQTHEKVYDVAWGDAGTRQAAAGGKLPPVGNTVDIANASWTNTIGDPELITVWKDPDFDPTLKAFYYARVIEIPTPRWTAYDAKRFSVEMSNEVPMETQERAYTTPIWYTP